MFDKKMKKRNGKNITTGFPIPNIHCKSYSDPLGCVHSDTFHTCCKEECPLMEVIFGEK